MYPFWSTFYRPRKIRILTTATAGVYAVPLAA